MTLVKDRLYHTDYYAWTQEQAAILRRLATSRPPSDLDLENLAEEVADLRKSERRALRSQMRRLIEHLFKLDYATSPNPQAGWRRTILDASIELADDLTPTLRRELEADRETLHTARYQTAETLAALNKLNRLNRLNLLLALHHSRIPRTAMAPRRSVLSGRARITPFGVGLTSDDLTMGNLPCVSWR